MMKFNRFWTIETETETETEPGWALFATHASAQPGGWFCLFTH